MYQLPVMPSGRKGAAWSRIGIGPVFLLCLLRCSTQQHLPILTRFEPVVKLIMQGGTMKL